MYLLFVLRYHNLKKNAVSNAFLPQLWSLNPLKDMAKDDEVIYLAHFDDLYLKIDEFDKFFRTGKGSYNMLRYIPSLAKVGYQGQLHSTESNRKYVDDTYNTKKVIELNVQLTKDIILIFETFAFAFL